MSATLVNQQSHSASRISPSGGGGNINNNSLTRPTMITTTTAASATMHSPSPAGTLGLPTASTSLLQTPPPSNSRLVIPTGPTVTHSTSLTGTPSPIPVPLPSGSQHHMQMQPPQQQQSSHLLSPPPSGQNQQLIGGQSFVTKNEYYIPPLSKQLPAGETLGLPVTYNTYSVRTFCTEDGKVSVKDRGSLNKAAKDALKKKEKKNKKNTSKNRHYDSDFESDALSHGSSEYDDDDHSTTDDDGDDFESADYSDDNDSRYGEGHHGRGGSSPCRCKKTCPCRGGRGPVTCGGKKTNDSRGGQRDRSTKNHRSKSQKPAKKPAGRPHLPSFDEEDDDDYASFQSHNKSCHYKAARSLGSDVRRKYGLTKEVHIHHYHCPDRRHNHNSDRSPTASPQFRPPRDFRNRGPANDDDVSSGEETDYLVRASSPKVGQRGKNNRKNNDKIISPRQMSPRKGRC